jgi:hypothetical protein
VDPQWLRDQHPIPGLPSAVSRHPVSLLDTLVKPVLADPPSAFSETE